MNESLLDSLTILSFVVGIMNLELNTEQVENLDKHLAQQDKILIEEQNEMLKKAIRQNDEIISLLKELLNALTDNRGR